MQHFIEHYTGLGVDAILLAAHETVYPDVLQCASGYPVNVFPFQCNRFDCLQKHAIEKELVKQFGVCPDDYVIYCDIDEFQEYPAPLTEIVRIMDERGLWALRGYFIDRLAADGRLATIRPEPNIFSQFPVRCRLSRNLLHAWDQKIMLCRSRFDLDSGHHDTHNAQRDEVPIAGEYIVHHFKWTQGLVERIRERIATGAVASKYIEECEIFLKSYDCKRGFDLSDGRLGILR